MEKLLVPELRRKYTDQTHFQKQPSEAMPHGAGFVSPVLYDGRIEKAGFIKGLSRQELVHPLGWLRGMKRIERGVQQSFIASEHTFRDPTLRELPL